MTHLIYLNYLRQDLKMPHDILRLMLVPILSILIPLLLISLKQINEYQRGVVYTMATTPGALHLRTLNSINDISSDQSNTVIFAVPLEILRAIEGIGNKLYKK